MRGALKRAALLLAAVVVAGGPGIAQTTTGTVSGHVADTSGAALPGVRITAESPALQGIRSTTSNGNGDYLLPFLPAGQYTVRFELQGFQTLELQQGVSVAQVYPINVRLGLASLAQTVQVVGNATIPPTATGATSVTADLVARLPTTRTLEAMVLLAPGVKNTGPNQNITIQGALSYENLFLVNGVVVNENLRGQPLPLYIEDALLETTVATSGVSAEHGRFSGGVVNATTKSGGSTFHGSFRSTLTNDNWRALTPYPNDTKVDKTVPSYELTLGGPVTKEKLWFFGAARLHDTSNATTGVTAATDIPYQYGSDEKRADGKLTYSPDANDTIRGSYARVWNTDVNSWYANAPIMDRASLYTSKTAQDLLSLNYTRIIKTHFLVEAQFSRRHWTGGGIGSPYTDPIKGTLLVDQSRGARFWSPTFCGACGDDKRDNQNALVKGTYFFSTSGAGSHTMVFGFDQFRDKHLANNHQSGSDYRIYATTSIVGADGGLYPVFDSTTLIQYNPIPLTSVGNNFRTDSLFVNDAWQSSNRLSLNLGVRWDRNSGSNQTGAAVLKSSAFSPRLGLSYDIVGNGTWVVAASYGRYVTSIANIIGDASSSAGNPATYRWFYGGPAVNAGGPVIPTDQAIQQVFDWFNANGGPNTTSLGLIGVSLPGVDTRVAPDLGSPSVDEVGGSLVRQIGSHGTLDADVTYRQHRDFYSDRVDQTTGQVTNALGQKFDVNVIENTNDVQRKYAAMSVQATYRLMRTQVGGNYTLSRTWGNFDGEGSTGGPSAATPNYYPEYTVAAWNRPVGDLTMDQRHRARFWVDYAIPVKEAVGTFSVSVLENLSSGTPYGASGLVNSSLYVPAEVNAAYVTPMGVGGTGVTYFFAPRDAFSTDGEKRTDLALNYNHRLGGGKAQVFVQAQALNVFNQSQLYNISQINTTVLTRVNNKNYQPFNPFTESPVLGTNANWNYGPIFGRAVGKTAYTTPRTFLFSVGARF